MTNGGSTTIFAQCELACDLADCAFLRESTRVLDHPQCLGPEPPKRHGLFRAHQQLIRRDIKRLRCLIDDLRAVVLDIVIKLAGARLRPAGPAANFGLLYRQVIHPFAEIPVNLLWNATPCHARIVRKRTAKVVSECANESACNKVRHVRTEGMANDTPPLKRWRTEKGWTLEDAAREFGITSKGYLSEIENGKRCSVSVALEIERVTEGAIPAASLSPDVALVDQARAAA